MVELIEFMHWAVATVLLSLPVNAQTENVLFKVFGINKNTGGFISSGIFTKTNFPGAGLQFRGKYTAVTQSHMEVMLENVPVGTYGAVVFYDENGNRELHTHLVGFPVEPIGFANGARISFGRPGFEDAAIN